MKEESQREYNMTDAELAMFTSNLVQTMTRDATEFAAKGVDAIAIAALETLGNQFEVFPSDEYYQADVSLAVNNKDADREQLEMDIRAIVGLAVIKWGEGSPQYNKFRTSKMMNEDDKKFLTTARQVVTTATDYLTDLTSLGLTQIIIDALGTLAQSYEDNLNAINSAVEVRDIKTQERIELGNLLYSFVVRYCEIGKIIWQDLDEAKYNDYVIYHTTGAYLPKPTNVQVSLNQVPSPWEIDLTWDLVTGATSYRIFQSIVNTGQPSGEYAEMPESPSSPYPPVNIPPIYDMRQYFKIRAKNAHTSSEYSDEVYLDIPAAP